MFVLSQAVIFCFLASLIYNLVLHHAGLTGITFDPVVENGNISMGFSNEIR